MELIVEYLNSHVFMTTRILLLVLMSIISWFLMRSITSSSKRNGKIVPGPIGLPIVGYLPFLGKDEGKTLKKLSNKYGDMIGLYFGSNYTVVLNEYNVAKEVLSHPGAQDRATHIFDLISSSGFHMKDGEEWIEQRRFCRSTTRDIGLGRGYWEELIMEEVINFTDKLRASKGEGFDYAKDLHVSVLSNIFPIIIGRRLNKDQEGDKMQVALDFMNVSLHYIGPAMAAVAIPVWRKFCAVFKVGGYHKVSQIVKKFWSLISEEIKNHKTSSQIKENYDFISIYLEKMSEIQKSKYEEHFFSEPMLHGNVLVLLLGPSDSIFTSLCWLLRLMATHKDIQEKVYTELIESVGKEGRARYEERDNFPYTFATIMEGQRVSSIVPLSTNRKASEDIHVNGMVIPKGSDITANLWALHNDPNYWEQPELFKPERFLEDDGKNLKKHVKSYMPFSFGRRDCPGASIAYMEILLYFSEIIKQFEVSFLPEDEPQFKVINGLVRSLKPQLLCFKERNSA